MTPVLALSTSISDFGFTIFDCEGIITDGMTTSYPIGYERFALYATLGAGSVSWGFYYIYGFTSRVQRKPTTSSNSSGDNLKRWSARNI